MSAKVVQRSSVAPVLVGGVTVGWALALVVLAQSGHSGGSQLTSNLGLAVIALLAGAAAVRRGIRVRELRGFWILLGAASLAWSAGQMIWTWYESVLGRAVPFPSLADVGYLGLPPLAACALLCLPLAAPTLAGRLRAVLDGLIVALSLLLVSWVLVLGPVVRAGGDSTFAQTISLAYPVGDTVVITIVIFTWLQARQSARRLPISLFLVGGGLLSFAVADSGFA